MTAEDKEFLHSIHEKHYGKGSKVKKENVKLVKVIRQHKVKDALIKAQDAQGGTIKEEVGIDTPPIKAGSRAALMQQAKDKGIKYFRILTKEELTKVLQVTATKEEVEQIIETAKARWQAGMKEKK